MTQLQHKKPICFLLTLLLLLTVFSLPIYAENTQPFAEIKNPSGKWMAVSKYGNTRDYPEQSVEAILSAAEQGADMIYVHVRKTSDNYFVLMADENLSRMCVDSLGNVVNANVSDIGYHELSTYHLRQSTGSLHESITESVIPTLQEAIAKLEGKALLLVDGAWEYRDELYTLLTNENALNTTVLLSRGDKKETTKWLSSKATMPLVVSSYHGNIVFNAKNTVSKTLSGGAVGTLLSTGNAYGMNFKPSVMSLFKDNGRAIVDMTDPALCGKRKDNPEGWNDVTARGYSVIITDNVPELIEYFHRTEKQKSRLVASIDEAQKIDVTLCSTNSSKALKKALTSAKTALQEPYSEQSLTANAYELRTALNGLTNRTENEGKTVTPGRIVAVVLVILALILLEVVFETIRRNKLKKRKKALREKRAEEERNQKS